MCGLKLFRSPPVLVAALLLLLAVSGRTADGGVFNPQTFELANGMQVVVVPNHRVPVVTHMVWYKAGSADDPPGKSGIAHLLEHLMFKGTNKLKPGEFSEILARNGGQENAFTSRDYTAYYQSVAVDRLELVMEMEADRMTNLVLGGEDVETEKRVILEERRQRTDNNPGSILAEHLSAALFLNHPYRRPIIGWQHEIEGLTLADALSFYRRWYAPNNAILTVAGDITAEELRPLAEKYYGRIPSVPAVARSRPTEPPHRAARQVVLSDERVRQPTWSRTFLAPSYTHGAAEHAYPLEVLSEILGGGATTRLYRTLVVERKLAISAGASYSPDSLGPTGFAFYASPQTGVSVDRIEREMELEIARLLKDGVSREELDRAKRGL
ncbi:MAG: pitrilysin family protein, partial [Rhodospirillales bacterium]